MKKPIKTKAPACAGCVERNETIRRLELSKPSAALSMHAKRNHERAETAEAKVKEIDLNVGDLVNQAVLVAEEAKDTVAEARAGESAALDRAKGAEMELKAAKGDLELMKVRADEAEEMNVDLGKKIGELSDKITELEEKKAKKKPEKK